MMKRTLLQFLLLGVMLTMAGGCTRKVYLPVESVSVRTDTVTRYLANTDSVTVIERVYESDTRYDSIAPVLDSLGRVSGFERWHFRELTRHDSREIERLQSLVDSLRAVRTDSVDRPVPYPVERPLTRWESVKMRVGGWAVGFGCVAVMAGIAAIILWILLRRRKI